MENSHFKSNRSVIIGAGITGLYLAWKLSERGGQVTVLERNGRIGKEVCSGLFSERITDFIPQSKKLIENEINFVLIHFPKRTIRIDFARKFFLMSHAELDRLTAGLAENSGAKILLNRKVSQSVLDRLAAESDKLIGCDGASSTVRKYLGLPQAACRLGILAYKKEPRQALLNYVETWPVKNGFIWKIPRGKETEYGIIAPVGLAKKLFDDFCFQNRLSLSNPGSALVPQGFLLPENEKITLCGDAAGLTKPWSGGGVIWGLQSAELLLKNFPDLLGYRQAAKSAFYRKIAFSKFITRTGYFFGYNLPWLLPETFKIEGDRLL